MSSLCKCIKEGGHRILPSSKASEEKINFSTQFSLMVHESNLRNLKIPLQKRTTGSRYSCAPNGLYPTL